MGQIILAWSLFRQAFWLPVWGLPVLITKFFKPVRFNSAGRDFCPANVKWTTKWKRVRWVYSRQKSFINASFCILFTRTLLVLCAWYQASFRNVSTVVQPRQTDRPMAASSCSVCSPRLPRRTNALSSGTWEECSTCAYNWQGIATLTRELPPQTATCSGKIRSYNFLSAVCRD